LRHAHGFIARQVGKALKKILEFSRKFQNFKDVLEDAKRKEEEEVLEAL